MFSHFLKLSFILFFLGISSFAYADQEKFCAGFEEGYKIIKGDNVMVPMCPMAPMTPMGSTPYREGIKRGMELAKQ